MRIATLLVVSNLIAFQASAGERERDWRDIRSLHALWFSSTCIASFKEDSPQRAGFVRITAELADDVEEMYGKEVRNEIIASARDTISDFASKGQKVPCDLEFTMGLFE